MRRPTPRQHEAWPGRLRALIGHGTGALGRLLSPAKWHRTDICDAQFSFVGALSQRFVGAAGEGVRLSPLSRHTPLRKHAHRIKYLNKSWWRLLGEEVLFSLVGCEGPLAHMETQGQDLATNRPANKGNITEHMAQPSKKPAYTHIMNLSGLPPRSSSL